MIGCGNFCYVCSMLLYRVLIILLAKFSLKRLSIAIKEPFYSKFC